MVEISSGGRIAGFGLFAADGIDGGRLALRMPRCHSAVALATEKRMQHRLEHLVRFYDILATLERRIGGRRLLAECRGRMDWPLRGIYFFMEEGERRTDTGTGLRIVRVGTHALKAGSRTTLWHRLSQHKGQEKSGGGNHRGSIFRLLVGSTLMKPGGMSCQSWG